MEKGWTYPHPRTMAMVTRMATPRMVCHVPLRDWWFADESEARAVRRVDENVWLSHSRKHQWVLLDINICLLMMVANTTSCTSAHPVSTKSYSCRVNPN